MKIGIVRRVDDLGRIVIPREIRRSLGIREGEPMIIEVEGNALILRRYETDLLQEVARVAELVEENCIADDKIISEIAQKFVEITDLIRSNCKDED